MKIKSSSPTFRCSLRALATGAVAIAAATIGYAGTLEQDIDALLHMPTLRGSVTGVMVADIRTHKILYVNNAETRLIPASNRKLFTAASALHFLGDNYQTHTALLADVSPGGDTLHGNIYLRGGGDALLTADDVKALAAQLMQTGVRHITGDIIGDASIFSDGPYPEGWAWDYLSDDYAPQIAGLEVEQGLESVTILPGKSAGDKPTVKLVPASGYMLVDNHATTTTAGTKPDFRVYRPYDRNTLVIAGSVPLDYKQDKPVGVPVVNPALYATTLLAETLLSSGITIDGSTKLGVTPPTAVTVADHASVALRDYLPFMLKPSNNLVAECLVRLIGHEKGASGTFDAGYAIESPFFSSGMGIPHDVVSFSDGSGVSRLDLVSPHAVVKMLTYTAMQPNFKVYYDALPIAGVDGTLRNRMKGTAAEGNCHAKTGTVRYCHALSGYVSDQDANILAFSIINNNYNTDSSQINVFQDALVARLANEHSLGIMPVIPIKVKPLPPAKLEPTKAINNPVPLPTPTKVEPTKAINNPVPLPPAPRAKPINPPAPPISVSGEPTSVAPPAVAPAAKPMPAPSPAPTAPALPVAAPTPVAPAPVKPPVAPDAKPAPPVAPVAAPHAKPAPPAVAPKPVEPKAQQPKAKVAPMPPPQLALPPELSPQPKPAPTPVAPPAQPKPTATPQPAPAAPTTPPGPSPVAVPATPDDDKGGSAATPSG